MKQDCRFCVRPEPDRVIHETENFVAMMGLGPLTEGYVLILSREHVSCCAAIEPAHLAEFLWLYRSVSAAQTATYGSSLAFEHGRSGTCLPQGSGEDLCYHAHLHLMPTAVDLAARVGQDFRLRQFADWTGVRRFYAASPQPYLLVQDGPGLGYVPSPARLPRQYLRSRLAELLDVPHLADWMAFPSYAVIRRGKAALAPAIRANAGERGSPTGPASAHSGPTRIGAHPAPSSRSRVEWSGPCRVG